MWVYYLIMWVIAYAVTYDFYSKYNDIRTLFILIIPLILQIISMICESTKNKHKDKVEKKWEEEISDFY